MKTPIIEEARAMLGEEFDHVPDQSIEMIIHTFNLIAQMLIEKVEEENR